MISDEIIKVLDVLGEKFGIVIDWAQQNIQPYIQDLCQRVTQYKLSTSIIGLIFAILLLVVSTIWFVYTIKTTTGYKNKYELSDDDKFIRQCSCFIITPIMCLISLIVGSCMIDNICMCIYVPERVLIDMISSM